MIRLTLEPLVAWLHCTLRGHELLAEHRPRAIDWVCLRCGRSLGASHLDDLYADVGDLVIEHSIRHREENPCR